MDRVIVTQAFYEAAHELYSAAVERHRGERNRIADAMREFAEASNAQQNPPPIFDPSSIVTTDHCDQL